MKCKLLAWLKNIWGKAAAALGRCLGQKRKCPCEELKSAELLERQTHKRYEKRSEEYYALRDRLNKLPGAPLNIVQTLTPIMSQPLAELRDGCAFDVRVSEDGDWELVTDHCALGGCDMGIIHLPTERDALIFAAILKAVGYQWDNHTACPECYTAYISECI